MPLGRRQRQHGASDPDLSAPRPQCSRERKPKTALNGIHTHAKRLRLPLVAGQAVRYAEEAAAARHDHLEFLAALLDAEVAQRDVNVERAQIAQARFPELKELGDFNFSLVPSVNATLVSDLARCSYIDHREVVLAVGAPGTGKTHTAIGLGLAACRRGKRVRFVTVAELVLELAEAQAEHRLSRLEEQLDRIDLLVCDELGFVRLDADQAQLLFILLAHRYTRGGLILTSNLEFADWTSVFNDDARLTAAGEAIRIVPPISRSIPDPSRRLELFDRATERQRLRQGAQKGSARTGRGWRREELYTRGLAD